MVIMEFIAKNAALRRSKGDWILTTNADILLSEDTASAVANICRSGEVHVPVIYRATRHDLAENVAPSEAHLPKNWSFSHQTTPPYHSEGAGDFLFASKAAYFAVRGFNETIRFAKLHKDTQFCIHAHRLGFKLEVIGDIYHQYHFNSWIHLPTNVRFAGNAPWGKPYNYRANLPYLNSSDWGLQGYGERQEADRIWHFIPGTQLHDTIAEPALPSNVFREARFLWNAARSQSLPSFEAEYVHSHARLLRSQPDPMTPAIAVLRRYVQSVWEGLTRFEECQTRSVALYGAGRHTHWLLPLIRKVPGPTVSCILDDFIRPGESIAGIPVVHPESIEPETLGAIVISSDLHEERLVRRCQELYGNRVRVVRLYENLPTGLFTFDQQGDAAE